ncbi:hypothetical protein DXO150_19445, partial [Xanthomonas oryzae pv. oryzae]
GFFRGDSLSSWPSLPLTRAPANSANRASGAERHACQITRGTRLRFLFWVSPKYSSVSGVLAVAAVQK